MPEVHWRRANSGAIPEPLQNNFISPPITALTWACHMLTLWLQHTEGGMWNPVWTSTESSSQSPCNISWHDYLNKLLITKWKMIGTIATYICVYLLHRVREALAGSPCFLPAGGETLSSHEAHVHAVGCAERLRCCCLLGMAGKNWAHSTLFWTQE